MIAAFPQLHREVIDARSVDRTPLIAMQELQIFLIEGAIILLLQHRQLDLDQRFLLRGHGLLDIFLQSTQNVRPDGFVQLRYLLIALDIAVLPQKPI